MKISVTGLIGQSLKLGLGPDTYQHGLTLLHEYGSLDHLEMWLVPGGDFIPWAHVEGTAYVAQLMRQI